jgi:hypothetical protein
MRDAFVRSVLPPLVALCLAAPAWAQVQTGEIFGRVTDSTGAIMPGVTVTVSGPSLIRPQVAVTSSAGSYRIPSLPIGTYTVIFELPGFKRLVREGVVLRAGFNAEISPRLQLSALEETVTVSGESPIVDTKEVRTGENFTREMLDALPSARDPWVILEMTPGVIMSGQNVGGSGSGQQSGFTSYGDNGGNTMWNVDGVTITDMAATGASPMYYDFDSFAEIQIQTGGNDASQQTGGINLNMITKSGSNQFRGSGRFFLTDNALQANNISDALYQAGAGSGNPIRNIRDYGFEIGGPIWRNKAWFWGGYGTQDIEVGIVGFRLDTPECDRTFTGPKDEYPCLAPDITTLENYNAKVQYQPAVPHKLTFSFSYGDKVRNARGASRTRPPETAWKQTGPTSVYKAQHQWIPSDRMTVDSAYAFTGGGFALDTQTPDQHDVQMLYDRNTGMYQRSYFAYFYDRPQHEVKSDFNYFLPNVIGGDHSMKWGVRWRSTPSGAYSVVPGGLRADHRNGVSSRAILYRPYNVYSELTNFSAYFNNSFNRSRYRLNVGVRVDRQDDSERGTSVPANPIVPDLLPALSFPGVDSGRTFTDVSPRLGATWDIFGTGKTVAKASGAIYYGQGNYTSGFLNPLGTSYIIAPWNDANGDLFVTRDELGLNINQLQGWSNWNPNDPGAYATLNDIIDPDLQNDRTREVIVGIDHELLPNFGVQVNYIYRKYDRFQYTPQLNQQTGDYVPNQATVACGNDKCPQATYDITYYTLPYRLTSDDLLTNDPFYRTNHSVEFVARKRMSARWMMNGSLVLQRTRGFYPEGRVHDPTNIPFLHGQDSNTRNARWVGKLMGAYSLPWGVNVSGFLNARDGYPRNIQILSPNRPNGLGAVAVYTEPRGTTRYDPMVLTDFRAEKWFDFGRTRVAASMDVFNAFNSNVVLDRENRLDRTAFDAVQEVVVARVVRFGIRMSF